MHEVRATQTQGAAHPQFRAPFSGQQNHQQGQQQHASTDQQAGEERRQPGELLASRREEHDLVDFQRACFLHHIRLERVNSKYVEAGLAQRVRHIQAS